MDQRERIINLKKLLNEKKLKAILITSIANIAYLTGYHNFSLIEREAYLVIAKDKNFIITDGRYSEAVLKNVPNFELLEISPKNPLKNIFRELKWKHHINNVGMEGDNITFEEFKLLEKVFKKIVPIKIRHRSIKNPEEVNLIQQACRLGDEAFKFILTKIKTGISEKELAFELEYFIRKNGSTLSFESIMAFGKNSSIPHHHSGEAILGPETNSGREGQFVLLDFGVKFNNYCSDMSRTVFFGKPTKKQKEIYQVVLEAQQKAIEFIQEKLKIGEEIKAKEVDKAARDNIKSKGYPSIPHGLGHGIGLEVHEPPRLSPKSKDYLKEGAVFSIEPGIYIPDFGGVRIEDLYVIKDGKLTQLTQSPKNLIAL
ncbi:aminopeptidase P family protein [Candidatus Daviesbacteria bacterium]|nr:aminopeptidase P family protein [Candidatus Daviesbacteria bacterium]